MALAFVLLWNSGFIGAEYGLPYAGPFTLLFWRYLALTTVLLLYLLFRGRALWRGLPAAAHASFVGVLAHGVWLGCVLVALARGVPAGIVALVVALQPLTTGAFSGLAVGERTNRYQWLGLVMGFCGVAISIGARLESDDTASAFGYLVPFGSVVAITAASLLQRRQETTGRTLPLDVTLYYQSLATTIAFAVPALFVERLATEWTVPFLATMAWLILAVSLGAYGLMWLLLARIDATRVASLFYFGPPVTMVMAWIAFGDVLWITDVIGLAVAAFGVLLVNVRRTPPRAARV
jgi:drug/metabolite transporter (DMT)-like permease